MFSPVIDTDVFDPEFDVPVLHVERVQHTYSKPNIVTEAQKLMHRFTVEEVEKLVDVAEQGVE